jgi:hypothetical protein
LIKNGCCSSFNFEFVLEGGCLVFLIHHLVQEDDGEPAMFLMMFLPGAQHSWTMVVG